MLNDRQRQLLTGHIDGELNDAQRRQVERLLEQSEEARALLRKLERDAGCLRRLPCPVFPGDLSGPILQKIAAHRSVPARPRVFSRPAAFPAWAGMAIAASVLFVIGAGAFFYLSYSVSTDDSGNAVIAQGQGGKPVAPPEKNGSEEREPGEADVPETPTPPVKGVPPTQVTDNKPENPAPPPEVQVPEKPRPDPIAAPSGDREEMKIVTVHRPTVLKVRELDQDAIRQRMVEELRKDAAFRIELPCRNATKALERLQAAGKDHPLGFIVDPTAAGRMKNPQLKTHFVLFLEDQTPEELTRLFQLLAAEERKGAARKPPELQFDRVVLGRLNKGDRKELADYLGLDAFLPLPPRSVGPLGTDLRQSLPDLTASQVSQSLAGQGSGSASKGARPPERSALVLTYGAGRARAVSPEAKRFLDARKPRRPGTLQIMLVLRSLGN